MAFINITNFSSKDTLKYTYIYIKQVNNFEKIFAIASSEKGLASIIYKEP